MLAHDRAFDAKRRQDRADRDSKGRAGRKPRHEKIKRRGYERGRHGVTMPDERFDEMERQKVEDKPRDDRDEIISKQLTNDQAGKDERDQAEEKKSAVKGQQIVTEDEEERSDVVMEPDFSRDPLRNRGLERFVGEDVFLRKINVPRGIIE